MNTKMKNTVKAAMETEDLEVPDHGVLCIDTDVLKSAGILFKLFNGKLLMWDDPESPGNEAFSQASVDMCKAAEFTGLETHMMYDAVNRAELNIRLVRVLQGKS